MQRPTARVPRHRPGRGRAGGRARRQARAGVPRSARGALHVGSQLRQPRLQAAVGPPLLVHPVSAAGRARFLGERRDPTGPFTTIGNWRQRYRDVQFARTGLPLEQAPAVHEDPRPAVPRAGAGSSLRSPATTAAIGCSWRSTGGGYDPASSSRATSTSTAITSSPRQGRSPPPRSRTFTSGPVGSASAAPPILRRRGR